MMLYENCEILFSGKSGTKYENPWFMESFKLTKSKYSKDTEHDMFLWQAYLFKQYIKYTIRTQMSYNNQTMPVFFHWGATAAALALNRARVCVCYQLPHNH